jgi:hypothetical protein
VASDRHLPGTAIRAAVWTAFKRLLRSALSRDLRSVSAMDVNRDCQPLPRFIERDLGALDGTLETGRVSLHSGIIAK